MQKSIDAKKSEVTAMQNKMWEELNLIMRNEVILNDVPMSAEFSEYSSLESVMYVSLAKGSHITRFELEEIQKQFNVCFISYHDGTHAFAMEERI